MDASDVLAPDAGRQAAAPREGAPGGRPAGVPAPGASGAGAAGASAADPYAEFADAPWTWSFFQALRRLEALHRDRPRFGRSVRPSQDAVRLAQIPTVEFAPATLAGWENGEGGAPARLLQPFFGLFGPDGPLPLHLTEYARDRTRNNRDGSFQHFADVFHHRALSLFYRAWANSRPTVSFDRPEEDRFGLYAGALFGLGMDTFRDRDAMPDLTKLHFAGHLSCQTRHAEGLAEMLSGFFGVAARVECFIGAWLKIPEADRSRLGTSPRTVGLGRTTLVGARVWTRQHKFRIVMGPLSLADYQRMLPGGRSFHRLSRIVRNYVGDTLIWDVNLILKREQVRPTSLGGFGQLGWTTWLTPRTAPTDAADLFLDASADSMASQLDAKMSVSAADSRAANLESAA